MMHERFSWKVTSCRIFVRSVGPFSLLLSADDPKPKPGVIILSAVLKRRMMLADKAKSLFISKWVNLLPIMIRR